MTNKNYGMPTAWLIQQWYNTSIMLANRLVLAETAWYKVDDEVNLPPRVTNENINGHS